VVDEETRLYNLFSRRVTSYKPARPFLSAPTVPFHPFPLPLGSTALLPVGIGQNIFVLPNQMQMKNVVPILHTLKYREIQM
jgi:hypothetical protein